MSVGRALQSWADNDGSMGLSTVEAEGLGARVIVEPGSL